LFQQRERRYGHRSSAAQVLFEHLAAYQPDWEDLPLPAGKLAYIITGWTPHAHHIYPGRTVAQGRIVHSSYSRQSSGPSTAHSAGPSPGSYGFPIAGGSTGGVTSRKRSAPSDSLTPFIGRPLAPKQPSSFGPETKVISSITGHQPISPMLEPSPRSNEPRKKRGRPTKQEAEERRRQMEERQQLRLQAQAAQAAHAAQTTGSYNTPFGPPLQPVPPSFVSQIPREGTPTIPSPAPLAQTPRNPSVEDNNSSGSSGKKRKTRPPRLSVSETEGPPPPSFVVHPQTTAYGSPPHSGSQRGGRPSQSARPSSTATGHIPTDQELPRFDANEDNRAPPNPRSRPWEVMKRSEP
jgi:hypothetical protein